MTKQNFKKHLTKLVELKKEVEKVENVMYKSPLKDDFSGGLYGIGWYSDLLVEVLEDAMDDKGGWISYFLYDRDMKFTSKNIINDKKGKNIPFKSIDDLYKLIISE